MPKYQARRQAKRFIKNHAQFISRDGESRALDFIEYMEKKLEQLANNPYIGKSVEHIKKDHRVWPDKKYKW